MRRFLRSKLHKATVTDASLEYEGSITIDEDLLDLAGIAVYEFVLVANMNNGERFETYVIPGERGKGDICLNGSAARKGLKGDRVIIFAFEFLHGDEIEAYKPRIVVLDENNKPKKTLP
ncbi:aspartate 1-decarboxylase [Nitrospirota bacterium]